MPRSLLMSWDPPEGPWAAGTRRWEGIRCSVRPEAEVSPVSRGAQGWGLPCSTSMGRLSTDWPAPAARRAC